MKILHICQYYNDGWGYQENLLPRYQKKLGHDVVVVTSDRRPFYIDDKSSRIVGTGTFYDNGVRIERIPIKWEFKNRFVIFKNLMQILEKEKPDYIFHHGLTMPSLITAVRYKKKHPGVFLATDNHSDLNISARNIAWRKFYYEWFWKSKLKRNLNYIDIMFGVTPARCYFPVKFLGVSYEKVRLLPIGVDTDKADTVRDQNREQIRNEFGISKGDIVTVVGGKLSVAKGIIQVINAVSRIKNLRIFLFGSLDDELKRKVDKCDKAKFIGWLDRGKTLKILFASDLAAWPRIHTTLVEDAIAVNTPLLLRYHGSTSHHIRGNGIYLFKGDELEIYQALKFISNNPEVLDRMREKSEKQRKILSYDQIARESVEYFSDLSPKKTHQYYMNDFYCNPDNPDFERRIF